MLPNMFAVIDQDAGRYFKVEYEGTPALLAGRASQVLQTLDVLFGESEDAFTSPRFSLVPIQDLRALVEQEGVRHVFDGWEARTVIESPAQRVTG